MRVSIQKLTKKFGDTIAVNDVSLEVRDQELFFLLGPSGCGKTTLLRLLAGSISLTPVSCSLASGP